MTERTRGISLRGIDRQSFGLPAKGERRPLKPLKERDAPFAVGFGVAFGGMDRLFLSR